MREDQPLKDASPGGQGLVSDTFYGDRIRGFRDDGESQGPAINTLVARETTKESNLRARLHDLGVPKHLSDRCWVHADIDPHKDTITMPWEVIYSLISSDRDRFGNIIATRMGVQG